MGSNFVNIGTDILQAYLGGKQVAMQKQKQQQEALQFQQKREDEAKQLQEQVKMHKESLQNAMEIHSAQLAQQAAQAKVANALQKAKIKTGLVQGYNQEGGFPQQEQLPDVGPTINNLTAPTVKRNVASYQPFKDIPELADISIGGNEVAPVSRMDRIAQENNKARAEAREDQQAARLENTKLLEEGRNERAKEANANRAMIAGLIHGLKSGNSSGANPEGVSEFENQIRTGGFSQEQFNQLYTPKERESKLLALMGKGLKPLTNKQIEGLHTMETTQGVLQDMINLGKKVNITSILPFTEQKGLMGSIESHIGTLRDILGGKGLGVLSNPDLERLEKSIPSWKDPEVIKQKKIKDLIELQNKAFDRILDTVPKSQRQTLEEQYGERIRLGTGGSSKSSSTVPKFPIPSNFETVRPGK